MSVVIIIPISAGRPDTVVVPTGRCGVSSTDWCRLSTVRARYTRYTVAPASGQQ